MDMMPTGSHAAAASKASEFAPLGNPKGSAATGGNAMETFGTRTGAESGLQGGTLSGWGSREVAAQGQRAIERPLDREFGIVTTTTSATGDAGGGMGAQDDKAHGARDGLHEVVPGDADAVVAPKEAMEEVEDSRLRHAVGAGAPEAHEHRAKHHRNRWTWTG